MFKKISFLAFLALSTSYLSYDGNCMMQEPGEKPDSSSSRNIASPTNIDIKTRPMLPRRQPPSETPQVSNWRDVQKEIEDQRDKKRPCLVVFDMQNTLITHGLKIIQKDGLSSLFSFFDANEIVTCGLTCYGRDEVPAIGEVLQTAVRFGANFPPDLPVAAPLCFEKSILGLGDMANKLVGLSMILTHFKK